MRESDGLAKAQFAAKERERLTTTTPIKFNGGIIKLANGTSPTSYDITLTQERQCKNLSIIIAKPAISKSSRGIERTALTPKDQYITQRARGAYIASVCQPESSFDLSFAAQVTDPTEEDIQNLNKRLQWQMENTTRGLRFVKLDTTTLRLLVFTDASFANNKDLSSQIGYSSVKCKRVTRSVLASELYGAAHGFDISVAIKTTLDNVLQSSVPLVLCTDSKSLYDYLVLLGTTLEKRLMIDVMGLRQAYERRLITDIKWVDGKSNPADAMTKSKPCEALQRLIDTNRIDLNTIGWVDRTGDGSMG